MLGLEELMRLAEIAAEDLINLTSAVKLFEAAHTLGAFRLKSYALNYILRELDKIDIKRELLCLNDSAFDEINNYLPKRIKRQTSKNGIFPSLTMIKLDKNTFLIQSPLTIKPHNPKTIRLPITDLQGILSLRNPVNGTDKKAYNSTAQNKKPKGQCKYRAFSYQHRENKNKDPPEFMILGVSPRSIKSVERSPVLRHNGLQISNSLAALHQTLAPDFVSGNRFLLYK